ncbi:MAG: FHA domain-containing protein [Prevotella sp.]|nr:FHA domain-containing protein [Prevotella sp.]MDD7606772.1 FHA domain-containing protein [Prevotellaceae bacterium]MDY3247244.1 FHA domain-containing protein [Prevotella sp.]
MEIGQTITIGRMGQQPMHIADTTVDPEHARLRRTGTGTYQIEDLDSAKGVFVFGMRVVRKTIKGDTPIFLGQYKTSVRQLLTDRSSVDLQQVWAHYEHEKVKWDRYSMLVNSIRMLTPIITMLLTQTVGQNWMVSVVVLVVVMVVAIVAGEKVLEKKTLAMAELNTRMQTDYVCPHCHRFLGLVPYAVLRSRHYCPSCGVPIQ